MKNIFFVILILPLMLANCKKNQSPVDEPEVPVDTVQTPTDTSIIELGKGYVLKNGNVWSAPFNAWYHIHTHERFQLRAEVTYSNFVSEYLSLRDIPCKTGKYPIEYDLISNFNNFIPEALFLIVSEFDQPMGDFKIDTTRNDHFVEVIRYDSIQQTVEGRFQVFLKKEPSNVFWPNVPDSIFLTEGKFHLKIQEP